MASRAVMQRALVVGAVVALAAAVANGAPISPSYDQPLPPVIKICVVAFPPFVMQRVRAAVRENGCSHSARSPPPAAELAGPAAVGAVVAAWV